MTTSIPIYAILGGTGTTGREVIAYLLTRDPSTIHLNIYVRSASKLHTIHPQLKDAPNVTIFAGDITDVSKLVACFRSCSAIISGLAAADNMPGTSVSQVAAHGVVEALTQLRNEANNNNKTYIPPPVVWPSSALLNLVFAAKAPAPVLAISHRALGHLFDDEIKAQAYLTSPENESLLRPSFWQCGMMIVDEARGYELSLTESGNPVSFKDVARGMVQMAEEDGGDKWAGQGVGFVSMPGGKGPAGMPLKSVVAMLTGLLANYLPGVWWFGRNWGWW